MFDAGFGGCGDLRGSLLEVDFWGRRRKVETDQTSIFVHANGDYEASLKSSKQSVVCGYWSPSRAE